MSLYSIVYNKGKSVEVHTTVTSLLLGMSNITMCIQIIEYYCATVWSNYVLLCLPYLAVMAPLVESTANISDATHTQTAASQLITTKVAHSSFSCIYLLLLLTGCDAI